MISDLLARPEEEVGGEDDTEDVALSGCCCAVLFSPSQVSNFEIIVETRDLGPVSLFEPNLGEKLLGLGRVGWSGTSGHAGPSQAVIEAPNVQSKSDII